MKRILFFSITFIFFQSLILSAQPPELKETFLEAESYFLFEEYNEALPLYLRIHRADPGNNNINFKIGVCFLNDPYQKEKSIPYLEQAVKDINPKYKDNNYKEIHAPQEAFYFLGNAYLVNNQLDKALENFEHFRNILDEKIYDMELVEDKIRICHRARNVMSKPVDYDFDNLGEVINTRFSDIHPIVSGDGKRLVFVSKQQFYDATFYSEKVAGNWQPPRNIIPELGVDGDVYPTSLSYDGNTMIIYRNDDFIGNLYISRLENGTWTAMQKLGPNINTKYWESHGTLSRDGNTLYFTSNRKGGFGGLDIYKSAKQPDGTWGIPVNLGDKVNTRYNEDTPFLTENEKTIYFSSYGHYNMGGYDVFYAKTDETGEWGYPVNLGYPINTTDDDLFFLPVNNGNNAYFSQFLEEGFGRHDIYYLTIYSDDNPRMYLITGKLSVDKGSVTVDDNVMIYLVDRANGDTIQVKKPVISTQSFELKAPKGDYDLLITSLNFNDLRKRIRINELTDKSGVSISDELVLESKIYEPKILTGEENKIDLKDSLFVVKAGEILKIKLGLEKGSTFIANQYADSILISSDTFIVDNRRFVYEFNPLSGTNEVILKMIDKNGDISIKKIYVTVENDEVKLNEKSSPDQIKTASSTEVENVQPSAVKDDIQQTIAELASYASGSVKEILDNLDANEAGITSKKELYMYLERQGIEPDELERLKALESVDNNLEELLKRMIQHSDGNLRVYLESFDPAELKSTDASALIDHLIAVSTDKGFTENDVYTSLRNINDENRSFEQSLAALEAEEFHNYLMINGPEALKNFLRDIDLEKEGLNTTTELIAFLLANVEKTGLTENELQQLLIEMLAGFSHENDLHIAHLLNSAGNNPVEHFYSYILEKGPKELIDILKKINFRKENIHTVADLVAYLLNNAEELGFTRQQMQQIIIGLLEQYSAEGISRKQEGVSGKKGKPGIQKIGGGLLLTGILFFIILFFKRRKRREETEK